MGPDFRAVPNFSKAVENLAKIKPVARIVAEAQYADKLYAALGEMIAEYDAKLDDQHEVGARLVSFGQTVVFHVTGLGYYNPSLIIFYGTLDDGSPVELIQHVSQISVMLTTLPKPDPNQPKRRFGFHPPEPAE